MALEAKHYLSSKGRGQGASILDRLHSQLSTLRNPATAFVYQPEPQGAGSFARGKQIIGGNFQFGGALVRHHDNDIWDIAAPDPLFEEQMHGFAWLDDLAAVSDRAARLKAQAWVRSWIARYGAGNGLGWSAELTGRRLIRWISHALFLLNGQSVEDNKAFFRSLSMQTAYLARRWPMTAAGMPRFEALTGLLYAGLSLNGLEELVDTASEALSNICRDEIAPDGGIATRNPEELMEIFILLSWSVSVLQDAGHEPSPDILSARDRIAPSLVALRQPDGGLARFHGGGRGQDGRLDRSLGGMKAQKTPPHPRPMGYVRLSGGRTGVLIDAAKPPQGRASQKGHAGTLAFEMTSGRRQVIVSSGDGTPFGPDWRRAGRATQSHSTLSIDGVSSSFLDLRADGEFLKNGPNTVTAGLSENEGGTQLITSHDGYAREYGLIHVRKLALSKDGRLIQGEDTLAAMTEADKLNFDKHMDRIALRGVPYTLRFHLHPDVDASIDMGGAAVSLSLKNGEVWVFRPENRAEIRLKRSVYFEKGRLNPRPTQQIVLSSSVMEYANQVRWVLAKAQDVPSHLREPGP